MKSLLVKSAVILVLLTSIASAGDWNTNDQNVVLDGYDVVAYHTMAKAVKGSEAFAMDYDGATFYFVSADHLKAFDENPGKYAPKYNGYCAFAVGAKNAKVPSDPQTFKLYNGELLVFFNDLWDGQPFNTKVPWNQQEKDLYAQAEDNWRGLSATE